MNGLVKLFGECPGCISGGGNPNCDIRECCKQKMYAVCAVCDEVEMCKKSQRHKGIVKRLWEVKAQGVGKWAKEMQRKVDAGYCYLDDKMG